MFLRKKVTPECLGGKAEMHYLTRRDVFHLAGFFAEIYGKAKVEGNELSLSPESLLALGDVADSFVSALLEASFPGTDWESVSLGDQVELLGIIWEANDVPGIVKNSTALIRRVAGTLNQGN